jgi:DNA-binding SARP family transcriptional activator
MDFRILGPLEVLDDDGRTVEIAAGRQRALLAVLLLHANEVVSVDQLIDALWGDRPPETAAKALQGQISALRKALGPERVETREPGYLLRVRTEELDAGRFEQSARTDPAAALAGWRGPALPEFTYSDFARGEIERLEELRLGCVERRIEADLAAGIHRELIPELEQLVAEHPLRERFRAQQMLALYRAGRQADALEAYRSARTALLDDLGIEPGAELP